MTVRIPQSLRTDVRDFCSNGGFPRRMIPLFTASVPAGSPEYLEDYVDEYVDLNDFCVNDPDQTFLVKATGDSMTGAGINDGDLLIVDRAQEAGHGSIVIAVVDGNLTVKRLQTRGGLSLKPENKAYKPIPVTDASRLFVWGVVTHVIHKAR